MNKQQKLKILLPILIVVMAVIWGPVIIGGDSKKGSDKSKSIPVSTGVEGSNADLLIMARSNERKQARTSYEEWGRNPFTLSASPKASVLEGIMWDAKSPKAIIDGDILGIGDQVESGEIVDIKPNSVIIKSGDREIEYRLGQ